MFKNKKKQKQTKPDTKSEPTISGLLEAMAQEICDDYCKYAAFYPEEDKDYLYEEVCPKCPLCRLI